MTKPTPTLVDAMPVNTPTIKLQINGVPVYVKREDMYEPPIPLTYTEPAAYPPPPFAKTRGLLPYLQALRERGIKTVAYMDTSISMASWGLSYCAPLADLHAVILFPEYKDGPRHNMEEHIKRCVQLGAEVLYLENPTQLAINWYRAREFVEKQYTDAVLLPQGLPFEETIHSVADEMKNVPQAALGGTIVTAVGSGTMTSGILSGLILHHEVQCVHGILVSEGQIQKTKRKIISRSHGGLFKQGVWAPWLTLYWTGYEYHDVVDHLNIPFPCNKYYDAKAWGYLLKNIDHIKQPILFWNVGA